MIKNIIASVLFIIPTVLAWVIDHRYLSPGRWFNKYYPCIQNPYNSFPCYGLIDVWAMIGLAIVAVIAFAVLVYRLVAHRRK
jgi:hypothetical protein